MFAAPGEDSAVRTALLKALADKDLHTARHCKRVSEISMLIAAQLHISDPETLSDLMVASLLHDIGKLGTPRDVLFKPQRLTELEWYIMKNHASVGEHLIIASKVPRAHIVGPIVRHTHEHFDGSGYPDGLSGYEIPLLSRIIEVADCFDAITSTRSYRQPLSIRDSVCLLHTERGIKHDPDILLALCILVELELCDDTSDWFD